MIRGLIAGLLALTLTACVTTVTMTCSPTPDGGQICSSSGSTVRN